MKSLFRAALMLALFAVAAIGFVARTPPMVVAFAQTMFTSTAPSETTINVGQLLAPWLQALIAAIVSLILALFGWLTVALNKRAGLESNAAVLAMEAHMCELLDTALKNAAGSLVMMAGNKLDGLTCFGVLAPAFKGREHYPTFHLQECNRPSYRSMCKSATSPQTH